MPAPEVGKSDQLAFDTALDEARKREAEVEIRKVEGADVIWAPQPGSQVAFLQCPIIEVLYHGTRGGGKSDAILMDFAQHVDQGHGNAWRGVIFRQTYPQLADLVAKSEKWFRLIFPGAELNRQRMSWEWPGGEVLMFRHMARPEDYWNYHGHEIPFIGWEELTTWPSDECYKSMFSCCRSSDPNVPRKIRATTNPYGCVPHGDVLTVDRGWVPIQEVTEGDEVVSVQPDGLMVSAQVSATVEKDFIGEMVSRSGRGISMEFTVDHRLPHLATDRSTHEVKSFDQLPGQAIIRRTGTSWVAQKVVDRFGPEEVVTRKIKKRVEDLPIGDFAELLGWYLAEGCVCLRDRAFLIAQKKASNVEAITSLLSRCGFHFRYDGQQFWVSEPSWCDYFAGFGKSRDKFVPQWFKQLPAGVLRSFFDSAMLGDGSNGIYYTISSRLADDVAEIATKLGMAVYISSRQREGRDGLVLQVSTSIRDSVQLNTGNHVYQVETDSKSVNVERRQFTGKVHCLTVPGTETFFVRQNGCVWLSGNTGHNWAKDRWRLHGTWWKTVTITDAVDLEGNPEPPRCAIHSHVDENKVLLEADPTYKTKITASARNKAMAKAWLHGSWDVVAGGMFSDVWSSRNVVEPFTVPASWKIDRAFDWGSSRPFSVGWYAKSDGSDLQLADGRWVSTVRGDLFRINEWYGWSGHPNEGLRMLAVDVAQGIVERELLWGLRTDKACRVRKGVADSSIFAVENGVSIGTDMAKPVRVGNIMYSGISWIPADKRPGSRKVGWELVRKMIRGSRGEEGRPRETPALFVVGRNCAQFLRTMLSLPRDQKDLDDVDTDAEDHIADEVRYRVRATGNEVRSGRTVGMV